MKVESDIIPRYTSTATQCTDPINISTLESKGLLHSQDSQDKCLLKQYFPNICNGRDGDRLSNTFALYNPDSNLHWKGVNIEVDPTNYKLLSENRKFDIANIHAATCSNPGLVHYFSKGRSGLTGLWEYSTQEYRTRWWGGSDVTLEKDTTPVQCTHLQVIIDQTIGTSTTNKNHYFDFISIHIEGSELSTLQSIDYNRVGFGVILVGKVDENEVGDKIEELLLSVGYEKVVGSSSEACSKAARRNNWFVNKNFDKIYEGYGESNTNNAENEVVVKRRNLRGSDLNGYMIPESREKLEGTDLTDMLRQV
ncbi:hypothetical protein ACHAXR_001113 [Thalassiosira sp. AJA248-18]